ncbi:MAG: class I SAM-dependent methyltransferase [Acidobacteriota bacterium]
MEKSLDTLTTEREDAERQYNERLTRLDGLHRLPIPLDSDPRLAESLRRLNELAAPVPAGTSLSPDMGEAVSPPPESPVPGDFRRQTFPAGFKGRVKEKLWVFLMRLLQIEERFGALSGRMDWAHARQREATEKTLELARKIVEVATAVERRQAELVERENEFRGVVVEFLNTFNQAYHNLATHLQHNENARIHFYQSLISLIDTKDRELNALINNHLLVVLKDIHGDWSVRSFVQHRVDLLSGRVDHLMGWFDRKLERMMIEMAEAAATRDQLHRDMEHLVREEAARLDSKVTSLDTRASQIRLDLLTRMSEAAANLRALKRRLDALSQSAAPPSAAQPEPAVQPAPAAEEVGECTYANFEARFRGSEELIKDRFRDYVEHFAGGGPVLDAGCGRGEFIELLVDQGIECYGVDSDEAMVTICREKALSAHRSDILRHLDTVADESLGGIFCAQVVEHLTPKYLTAFVRNAFKKLRRGGRMVVETLNPTSLYSLFEAYVRDMTHVLLLHPDTLRFLHEDAGFEDVKVVFRMPVPEELRLAGDDPNTVKLNRILFGPQDYAVIARKL